jgi:hypothetical protein
MCARASPTPIATTVVRWIKHEQCDSREIREIRELVIREIVIARGRDLEVEHVLVVLIGRVGELVDVLVPLRWVVTALLRHVVPAKDHEANVSEKVVWMVLQQMNH